jgi:iron complex outermembrane receptor protein
MVSARQAVVAILRAASTQVVRGSRSSKKLSSSAGMLCVLTASLSWSAHAVAQETAAATDQSQPQSLEEVTVTGSRIKRTTDFNTPTPTTVIDTATMQNMGLVNVGQAALLSPANVATFTPANTGNSNFFTGSYIADLRGLNPYFGSRTLLLIDGQRTVNSNQGDSFDMNLIPQILVSRIDTVTGGASAAYGSGAIAGVENIIIDNKLEGGKIEGDFDQTSHSDGKDRHIGAAYGHSMFDNRIHFEIGGEYENSDAVGCEDVRSWCAQNQGAYVTGTTPPASGSSDILGYGSNVRSNFATTAGTFYSYANFGGVHPGGPQPVTVSPDGSFTQPYGVGSPQISFADPVQGGDGTALYQYANLQAPVNRGTGMATLSGQITDYLNFKTNVLLAREQTTNYNGGPQITGDGLTAQNAFACPGTANGSTVGATCVNASSPTLTTLLNTPGGIAFSKDFTDQTNSLTRFTTNVQRFTAGLDGKFWDSSWTWDANYEFGVTHHDQLVQENLSLNRVLMALDTVNTPSGPECRVTADGFAGAVAANPGAAYAGANPLLAAGCAPLNPFGTQPLSAAAIAYAFPNLLEELRNAQTDISLNASGNIFKGVGAGPFSLAVGYEWRQERGDNIDQPGQPAYEAADFQDQYGSSFGGTMTVNEEYLEMNVPLLKDQPFAHLLELDMAGRYSQYANSALYGIDVCTTPGVDGCPVNNAAPGEVFDHNLVTWKASAIYEPVNGVRFRASQSRDERAPNLRELYYNQTIGAGGFFGQCGPAGTLVDPCTWNLLGNPDLKPENADTTTAGIVLSPPQVPGLNFSADWFRIRVNDAIEQANPILLETDCRQGGNCSAVTFNDNPVTASGASCGGGLEGAAAYQAGCYNLSAISPTSYNGAFYAVRGVDFSVNYLADMGALGTLNTRVLTTWMNQQEFQSYPGGPVLNILGQTGSGNSFLNDYTPDARWRGSVAITWTQGPISITPNMSYVGHGVMDYLGVTPSQGALYTETINGTLPAALAAYGFHPMPTNYVPSYFLFGLNATYSFANVPALKGLQVFAQVNNLFNKTPPFTGGGGEFGPSNSYGGTNPIFFDVLGLAYRLGFRLSF